MFATIDSPGNRVLFATGLDIHENTVYIDVARSLDGRMDRYVRSLPRQAVVQRIARQLLDTPLVGSDLKLRIAYEQLQRDNLNHPALLHFASLRPESGPHRKRQVNDPPAPATRLKAIRLQVFRVHFDPKTWMLQIAQVGDPVEVGPWR
jgi:hypothetical protein